jgi:hypothetical protein
MPAGGWASSLIGNKILRSLPGNNFLIRRASAMELPSWLPGRENCVPEIGGVILRDSEKQVDYGRLKTERLLP